MSVALHRDDPNLYNTPRLSRGVTLSAMRVSESRTARSIDTNDGTFPSVARIRSSLQKIYNIISVYTPTTKESFPGIKNNGVTASPPVAYDQYIFALQLQFPESHRP